MTRGRIIGLAVLLIILVATLLFGGFIQEVLSKSTPEVPNILIAIATVIFFIMFGWNFGIIGPTERASQNYKFILTMLIAIILYLLGINLGHYNIIE